MIESSDILPHLFSYDLLRFAEKLGLSNEPIEEIPSSLASGCLNSALQGAYSGDTQQLLASLTIAGLLWEYKREEWKALPAYLTSILTRMGLGPSAASLLSVGGKFASTGSLITDLINTSAILPYEVKVASKPILLTRQQYEMWKGLEDNPIYGISAPTSAGKSFILTLKIVDLISRFGGSVVYVVPTVSLIGQVSHDIKRALKDYDIQGYSVAQGVSPDIFAEANRIIYVLTQERALSAFGHAENPFGKVTMLVIDEVQNLERMGEEDQERSHILYESIQEFREQAHPRRIAICGPRVKNMEQLIQELFGVPGKALNITLPPVLNITHSFLSTREGWQLRTHSNMLDAPLSLPIQLQNMPKPGGKLYDDKFMSFLMRIHISLREDGGVLIFAPTPPQAKKIASYLGAVASDEVTITDANSLDTYLAETIHPLYSLAGLVRNRIGYHHGQVPIHARLAIEIAFKEKELSTIICTTTLLQGVNLPAKYLIARNPNLFVQQKEGSAVLSGYEFANLRGRAGRLMKEFIGKAIVLDETAFPETDEYLGSDAHKEIKAGYWEQFRDHRNEVLASLLESEEMEASEKHERVTLYIRHIILKYGASAKARLAGIGIALSDNEFSVIVEGLAVLQPLRDVCVQCPNWDPFIILKLSKLIREENWPPLPSNPMSGELFENLLTLLANMKQNLPTQYDKHIGNSSRVRWIATLAGKWARESPLHDILHGCDSEDQIDGTLRIIFKICGHKLRRILEPVVLIQTPENPILISIEMGAYSPQVRRLMELGVPREVAIRIRNARTPFREEEAPTATIQSLQNNISALPMWDRRILAQIFL
jgi:DEAD/DEAH box helicase